MGEDRNAQFDGSGNWRIKAQNEQQKQIKCMPNRAIASKRWSRCSNQAAAFLVTPESTCRGEMRSIASTAGVVTIGLSDCAASTLIGGGVFESLAGDTMPAAGTTGIVFGLDRADAAATLRSSVPAAAVMAVAVPAVAAAAAAEAAVAATAGVAAAAATGRFTIARFAAATFVSLPPPPAAAAADVLAFESTARRIALCLYTDAQRTSQRDCNEAAYSSSN